MLLELKSATLIKRYKRFLADITLPHDEIITIHCANTGAMTGCAMPGDTVLYSTSDNVKRKYPNSWEISYTQLGHHICVNTIRANQLVEEALLNQKIHQLTGFSSLKREVKYGDENSKIDFFLVDEQQQETYIEVKSVTLLDNDRGYFPDAKTVRGQKHLRELITMVDSGKRAVLLFAVLHSGINSVSPAVHIDSTYGDLLKQAAEAGVELLAYKSTFSETTGAINVEITHEVPVILY